MTSTTEAGDLPTAKEMMQQIALREAEKASAAAHEKTAAEAEKQANQWMRALAETRRESRPSTRL